MGFNIRNAAIEWWITQLKSEEIQNILVEEIRNRMSWIVSWETINNMILVLSETEKHEIIRKYVTAKVDEALISQGWLSKQRKWAYLWWEGIKLWWGEGVGWGWTLKSISWSREGRYSWWEDSRIAWE